VKYLKSNIFRPRCGNNYLEVIVSAGDSGTQVNHYLTVMAANSPARDERRAATATVFRAKRETFMPFRPPLRVSISRYEEKEQRLRQFVAQHIGANRPHPLLVVARSLNSPVVKAIAGLDQTIAAAGGVVRLILAQVDDEAQCLAGTALSCRHEIRWARHPRLIEAHEQLVLGPNTCWIGDCMRRDPVKCDAFENYVEDCGEAAGCAAVSFERLWFASAPLKGAEASAVAAAAVAAKGSAAAPALPSRQ
jgi:hypothetical protein